MSAFNPLTDSVQCLDSNNSVQMNNPYTFNGVNYGSYDFIGMSLGTYTFTGVTTGHPLGFVIDNPSLFEVISGTVFGTKTVESKEITHYYGTIVVEVKGDFGQISYNCYHHGYMGGQNKLVYHEPCSIETPTLTETPTQTQTDCLPDISTGNNQSYPTVAPANHIAGGTFEWYGGTQYTDPGLLPLKDLCDETALTLENGGVEVLYFDSSGQLPITNSAEIEKLGLLVPIELDNGTTIGPDSYTFKVKYELSYNNQSKIGGGRNITVKDCLPDISTGNNKSYPSGAPANHIAGGTFEWCEGTQYTDPGILPLNDLCDETALTLENGGVKVLYFDSSGQLPITNLAEIEKLGLLVPIELDNGTTIGPDPYTFKVKYELSYNNQSKIGGGRNITVKNCITPTPTITNTSRCVMPPAFITVDSEYLGPGNSIYKYITSDDYGEGGLFGCINAIRGTTLEISVLGEEVELVTHPLKITEYNNEGVHKPALDVTRIENSSGIYYDGTYTIRWDVPCDETVDQYQYQCKTHAHMRGTINVVGSCLEPIPVPTKSASQTATPPTPFQSTEIISLPISERILTKNDFKKFLSNCGSTEFSLSIDSYSIIHQSPSFNMFSVTYTCDLLQELNIDYCVATWESYCDGVYAVSSPSFECKSNSTLIPDSWYYSEESDSLLFSKIINACNPQCHESTAFIPPNPYIYLCPNYTPTKTETITPTFSETFTITPQFLHSPVKLTGTKPNSGLSVFFGYSQVLQKPNLTDKDFRVFYAESLNGYFYECDGSALNHSGASSDYINYKGSNLFFSKNLNHKNYREYNVFDVFASEVFNSITPTETETLFSDFELVTSSVCLETNETPTITESITTTPEIIKDVSLYKNIFQNSINNNDILTSPILNLNLSYWLSDLPNLIYGNSDWVNTVSASNIPKIEIIQDLNSLSFPIFSFSENFLTGEISSLDYSGINPTPTRTNSIKSNGDIYFNTLPSDYSSRFYLSFIQDPVNEIKHYAQSSFFQLTLKYSFTPDSSLINGSINPSSIPTSIIREEKIRAVIYPHYNEDKAYMFVGQTPTSTLKIFGVDKTLNSINNNFKVEEGFAVMLENITYDE